MNSPVTCLRHLRTADRAKCFPPCRLESDGGILHELKPLNRAALSADEMRMARLVRMIGIDRFNPRLQSAKRDRRVPCGRRAPLRSGHSDFETWQLCRITAAPVSPKGPHVSDEMWRLAIPAEPKYEPESRMPTLRMVARTASTSSGLTRRIFVAILTSTS